jgi:amidase
VPGVADDDLLFRPVAELAGLVRDGRLTAAELVGLSLHRIDELNPQLNAFVDVFADEALEQAGAVTAGDPRPFAGVPIAIKNNRAATGWRLTMGCDLMADWMPPTDHNAVARLKAAGFVIVGTTNLPEYGIQPVTEPRRFPATRNPWDRSRTPGGSSGGSGAAVAAGLVPIAHANDGGGSTRIPAACCGLVGLKAQRGRVSVAPDLGDHAYVTDGVLTRTVAETAQLLDLLAGYELGDATWAPPPAEPFARAVKRDPGPLRVGVAVNSPVAGATVDPQHLRAVADTAALLSDLGHDVVEIAPAWDDPALQRLFYVDFMHACATSIGLSGMVAGRDPRAEDMQGLSWEIWQRAQAFSALKLSGIRVALQRMMRALITELDPYDAVLTPGLAQRPLPIGTLHPDGEDPIAAFDGGGRFTPFTAAINASGQPALMLPLHHGDDGLPIAVQLIGRPARENVLLSLGAQLERALPWIDRRPEIAAAV